MLATILSASLAQLPPIIDAEQVAALLHCSKGQIEDLAESGRLPATKFGRGWVFVTAQIVYSVLQEALARAAKRAESAESAAPARHAGMTRRRSSKPLTLRSTPRQRGRPRKTLPACVTK